MATSTALVPLHPTSIVPALPFEHGVVYERVPAITDASTLIGDCLRFVKVGREPLLAAFAGEPGFVNLYATCSVRAEVEEHLAEAARENRLPVESVEAFWRECLRPLISFVDIDALPPRDPRVAELARIDPDDAPTGSLAELLGPCLVFSSDPHLVDVGIASKEWAKLLVGTRDTNMLQVGTSVTSIGTLGVGYSVVEIASALARAARRWPWPAVIFGAACSYFLYAYWQSDRGTRQRRDLRTFAVDTSRELGAFLNQAFEARALLERTAFVPVGDPTPLAGVARVVAAAPRPVRPIDIATRVGYSYQRVTTLLQEPIFERTREGYYFLGVRG